MFRGGEVFFLEQSEEFYALSSHNSYNHLN